MFQFKFPIESIDLNPVENSTVPHTYTVQAAHGNLSLQTIQVSKCNKCNITVNAI